MMDAIDRRARGAAHGPTTTRCWDALATRRLDTSTGSRLRLPETLGPACLLAATNRRTATRLLWECLASSRGGVEIAHVTAANQWAIDVGLPRPGSTCTTWRVYWRCGT